MSWYTLLASKLQANGYEHRDSTMNTTTRLTVGDEAVPAAPKASSINWKFPQHTSRLLSLSNSPSANFLSFRKSDEGSTLTRLPKWSASSSISCWVMNFLATTWLWGKKLLSKLKDELKEAQQQDYAIVRQLDTYFQLQITNTITIQMKMNSNQTSRLHTIYIYI